MFFRLYMEGYYPKIETLYPKIEFPVSTGTPMLSHLVEWAHNEKWYGNMINIIINNYYHNYVVKLIELIFY